MRDALRHRGPDGEGEWLSPCGQAMLGHTRLAIFDPTPAGRQPMSIADGRYTITYNGAIYNFAALRRTLEQQGVAFCSGADTEVILRLYQQRGTDGFAELQGMFALAVWDADTQTCVLARDPLGIKPLYYADLNGTLAFASEVRALVGSKLVNADLDPDGLYGFFRTGSVPEPNTLLRGVKCLPAGHHLTWTAGLTRMKKAWQLRFGDDQASGTALGDTRRVLADSIERHFAGDAPVGLFLSGGVDSSVILACAHAAGRRNIKTLSLSLPGTSDDEGPIARRTADHFGAEHHTCEMDSAATRAAFRDYVAATDQPSVDGLNTFVMARFAREHGVRVVLSGVGADELFGGYPTFTGVPRLAAWHQRFSWTGAIGQRLGWLAESAATDTRTRRVADMLTRRPSLDNAYQTYRGIFTRREAASLTRHYLGPAASPMAPVDDVESDGDSANAVTRFELTRYVRNQLLRDGDVMSMASGVEVRTPFLDAAVVDHLARVPAAMRLEPGKAFLRRAIPELPPWVADQPKRCFQFPFTQWADAEWREMLPAVPRNGAYSSTWYRRWCMFVMDAWMKRMNQAGHDES
jgi:asparagine synthase (glutamine-hydrolysing)